MKRPLLATVFAVVIPAGLSSAQSVKLELLPVASEVLWERLEAAPQTNESREIGLVSLFGRAGCTSLIEEDVRSSKLPNVVCTLPGRSKEVILIGAHYDKTNRGEGVFDNWSGASMLASLYEGLAATSRRYTYVFIGFSDEEKGLIGSRSHARQYKKDAPRPLAMINLDSLGRAAPSVWVEGSDERLVQSLYFVAKALKLPFEFVNFGRGISTDSESFRERKIPVISLHSVRQDDLRLLHTPADQLSLLDQSIYSDTYRLILAYLIYLDQTWPPPSGGDR